MTYALIAAGVLYVLVRRFMGEPLNARDLLGPPAFLMFFGIRAVEEFHPIMLLPLVVGFAFGALRGMTIKLFERDGHLWQRYTPWTLLVWVTSIVVSIGLTLLIGKQGPMQLSIGVSMLGELCAIAVKTINSGIPLAKDKRKTDVATARFYGRHGSP